MAARVAAQNRIQAVKLGISLLLAASVAFAAQRRFETFDRDLRAIRTELHIPGLAVAVVDGGRVAWRNDYGHANVSGHVRVSPATSFPIASVTKTMTAVLVMQQVEQGKLTLTDDLRRALSHTSDGTPGEEFLYNSGIFNSLTSVVEKAAGIPFADALRTGIFRRLAMIHTATSLHSARYLAKPYDLGPVGIKPGQLPGERASAASGVISTTADLAKFAIALDGTRLVSSESKEAMFEPTVSTRGTSLPYGLGWFTQTYAGERIVWHYGQESSFASLFVRIPSRKLTLIALANSSSMSDAPRLLDGNVARSPVALAFFRDVVFAHRHPPEMARDEMIDRALVELFLGRRNESAAILRSALAKYPELESSGELTVLGLFARLGFAQTETSATVLLKEHPYLPPAWFYYGMYLENAGRNREAAAAFNQITQHEPPWHHWSLNLAKQELKKLQ
jgi:CubicO group peptidase (beta-lactamase class C family)